MNLICSEYLSAWSFELSIYKTALLSCGASCPVVVQSFACSFKQLTESHLPKSAIAMIMICSLSAVKRAMHCVNLPGSVMVFLS